MGTEMFPETSISRMLPVYNCQEVVPETSVSLDHLTRFMAREDFTERSRHESFKSYINRAHEPLNWHTEFSGLQEAKIKALKTERCDMTRLVSYLIARSAA
jgi:hypothetical protein